MALDMTTALTIRAKVDGTNQIDGLNAALGRTTSQANAATGAFGKLSGLTRSVSSGLGALVPAATVAGLGALAKRSIDAADNLNDLSKRTGVGVESLSKFGAAANDSGSSVDEVAKAMGRLARSVVDPASKANEALRSIGVSSTDASGKVRSLDQIMLSVADVFAKMPDGAQKTALAMELFGKSGANLIPMLNEGSAALSKYAATVTPEMAMAADQFNDSINALAIALAGPFNKAITLVLPYLEGFIQKIVKALEIFTALPEPLQAAIIGFAGLAIAAKTLLPALKAVIEALQFLKIIDIVGQITGIIKVAGSLPAIIAGIAGAFGPLKLAVVGFFTGPAGWIALLVAAGIAIYAFRDQIAVVLKAIAAGWQMAGKAFYSLYVEPLIKFGKVLVTSLTGSFAQLGKALQAPFTGAVNAIKSIFRGLLQFIANGINNTTRSINALITGYNRLPTPDIPLIPQVSVPAFAAGGVVSGPTLAMVGEGGEREYIVPESKMATAAANYLGGMRGRSVIPAFADGGVVGPMGGGGAANTTVQITTGPVLQQDGQRYVTIGDLERALSDFGTQIFKNSRSYGGRRYQGAY